MAGAIVPAAAQQLGAAAAGHLIRSFVEPYIREPRKVLNRWRAYNRNSNPLYNRNAKSFGRITSTKSSSKRISDMPGYRKRRNASSKRSYKSKRRSVKRVKRIRKSARKYGNVRAAKALKIPLGGFQQRKIIRLKDCMSYQVQAPTSDMYGNALLGADGTTPLTRTMILDGDDAAAGKIMQQNFQLNNLRNYYCQGKLTRVTGTDGSPNTGLIWEEPPPATRDIDGVTSYYNVLKPLPLSRQPHVINVFKSYTVTGGRITFNVINKTSRTDSQAGDLGGFSIWYAYRITPQRCQDVGDGSMMIPDAVDPTTTYEMLKETGRWRMGSVPYARGAQKDANRSFTVNWTSKGIFGKEDGLPGAANVTGVFKGNQKLKDGDNERVDADGGVTPTAPNHQVWLQVIWGAQALSDVSDPNSATFGGLVPDSQKHTLAHVTVRCTSELYVSCLDPYPIQAVTEQQNEPTKPDDMEE